MIFLHSPARRALFAFMRFCFACGIPAFHRNALPFLLSAMRLNGIGVEVGVARGDFSATILKNSGLARLYSVDSWAGSRSKNYAVAMRRLAPFNGRSVIIRNESAAAAAGIPDESLDFIYIDADHTYAAALADCAAWWPKLKKGGIFSGHDYVNGRFPEGDFGVKAAVDRFLSDKPHGRLFVIPWKWPTWYCVKK